MRYRLRTLLIAVAIGPPALAAAGWSLSATNLSSGGGIPVLFVSGILLVWLAIAVER